MLAKGRQPEGNFLFLTMAVSEVLHVFNSLQLSQAEEASYETMAQKFDECFTQIYDGGLLFLADRGSFAE